MNYRCPKCNSECVEALLPTYINWDMNGDVPAEDHPSIFKPSATADQSNSEAWCLECEWRGTVPQLVAELS